MQKHIVLSLFLGYSPLCAIAQTTFYARNSALAGATVALADVRSVNDNQAGLGLTTKKWITAGYITHALLPELSTQYGAFVIPLKNNVFGVDINAYGNGIYKLQRIGLAYGRSFGPISFGFRVNYHQISITEYGSEGTVSINMGAQFKLTPKTTIGSQLINPTGAAFSSIAESAQAQQIRLGVAHTFSDKLIALVEVDKTAGTDLTVLGGLEYRIIKLLALRGGFDVNTGSYYGGLGFSLLKSATIDFATRVHPVLGLSPQIDLAYEF